MRKVRLFLLIAGIFLSLGSFAQSVTPSIMNATGGNYIFQSYVVEWSFGEAMAIETLTSPNIVVVTSGVLQPGTHVPATVNNNTAWGPGEIRITPNPTPDVLQIDFFSKQSGVVTMHLYDESGRFMDSRKFNYFGTGRIERWSLGKFSNGAYFINIQLVPFVNSVGKIGAFKVLKLR